MKAADDVIAEAWNVQNGEKVYRMNFGTSDVDGIMLALKEAGYVIVPEETITNLRGALAMIHNSTESDAIKHRDYEHLAGNIYEVAKAALDGEFVDGMHAAEVYDTLYPRSCSDTNGDRT